MACALASPASAQAAPVKIGAKPVTVSSKGIAAVELSNPNRSAARGTLTLRQGKRSVGRRAFRIPASRTVKVGVPLTVQAFQALTARGSLRVAATAAATGKGTARRTLTLRRAGSGGGGAPAGGGAGAAPPWESGRYFGNSSGGTNFDFYVQGTRLWGGPFDSHGAKTTCQNTDPEYTGAQTYESSGVIHNLEATIRSDGSFSGQGVWTTDYGNTDWQVSGRIAGKAAQGTLTVSHKYGGGNDPCTGSTTFNAAWHSSWTPMQG